VDETKTSERKTHFRLIVLRQSSTNPANLTKVDPVDVEIIIIVLREMVKKLHSSRGGYTERAVSAPARSAIYTTLFAITGSHRTLNNYSQKEKRRNTNKSVIHSILAIFAETYM